MTPRFATTRRLIPFHAAGLLAAAALKLFYSRAGADLLVWVLAPTAWLAHLLTGVEFERETGAGWISHSHRMILGPGCAGVNFMVIALVTFFLTFLDRFRTDTARWAWLAGSAGLAYALTIATNATRVAAAIHLYGMDIYRGALTPQGVHRAAGAAVYCISLLAGYAALERILPGGRRSPAARGPLGPLHPFRWYLAVALGLPLARQALGPDPARLLQHAIPVVLVCLAVALLPMPLRWLRRGAGVKGSPAGDRMRAGPHPAARLLTCEVEDTHRR